MHSFHQSRGRIAFEVLCTLTVSASCAAAWMQTGATAFLPAAAAAGLYGLWHLTDMRRAAERPATSEEAKPAVTAPVEAVQAGRVPATEAKDTPKPKKRSRKKQADATEIVEPVETANPAPGSDFPDRASIEEELRPSVDEEFHPPIAPLFETKPFAHQQRPAFGRKAG